jgi:hypothetical protein
VPPVVIFEVYKLFQMTGLHQPLPVPYAFTSAHCAVVCWFFANGKLPRGFQPTRPAFRQDAYCEDSSEPVRIIPVVLILERITSQPPPLFPDNGVFHENKPSSSTSWVLRRLGWFPCRMTSISALIVSR